MAVQAIATEELKNGWRAAALEAMTDLPPGQVDDSLLCNEAAADAAAGYVLEELAIPHNFTLEVRRSKVGEDPAVTIFRITFRWPGHGEWNEAFGSLELLQAFLKAVQMVLRMTGYGAVMLSWDIPEQWQEPSGRRWKIPRGGLGTFEDLDSDGNVIEGP